MGWEQSGGGLALNFDWVGDDKFYTGFREIFPKFLASKLMHHPISLSEHKYILKREEHSVVSNPSFISWEGHVEYRAYIR